MAIQNITTVNSQGEIAPIGPSDIGIISQLAFGIPSLYTLLDKADIDAILSMTTGGDASSLHNHDSRYFTETELTSNTGGATGADLLSSTPVLSGTVPTIQGNFTKIETKINALENLGIEWQDSVISISTLAPPLSPTQWDRYLIGLQPGLGVASGAWLNQDGKITTWDGSQWTFLDGVTGMFVSADDEPTKVYYFNGSIWEPKFFESTTASGFLSVTAGDVALTEMIVNEVIIGRDLGQDPLGVDTSALGDILADADFGLTVKDEVIGDTHIQPTAQIGLSKLEDGTPGYIQVYNGSGVNSAVAMSGDVEIDFAGTTTIQAAVVKDSMIDFGAGIGQVNDADLPITAVASVYTPVDSTLKGHLEGIDAQFTAQDYSTQITNLTNEDLTFLKLDGTRTMTGNLNMGSNEIQAVTRLRADVIANQNNATVFTMTGTTEVVVDRQLKLGGVTPSYKIVNMANGVAANDAVNVGQIPNLTVGKLDLAGGTMAGILNMDNHKITNVFNGSATGDAVNYGQLSGVQSTLDGAKVNKAGDTMTGNLNMNANKITSLLPGSVATDAVNKQQLDDVGTAASNATALKVDKAGDTMTGNLSMSGNEILGLPASPSVNDAAASKAYVDSVAAGLSPKQSVLFTTTGNVAGTYNNGTAGVGATLTATANGALSDDGETVTALNDRVLLKDQTNKAENGVYYTTQIGDGANPWIGTRCTCSDTAAEANGIFVFVDNGTLYGSTGWVSQIDAPIVIGTSDINFWQFSGQNQYTVGDGLNLTGNNLTLDLDPTPALEFASTKLRVKIKASAGLVRDVDGLSVNLGDLDTDALPEGSSNLYYSDVNFDGSLALKTTDDLTEGVSNLYYTEGNFDTSLSGKSTDDLAEGTTNQYYASGLFDSDFSGKTTTQLAEGTNLYHTDARAKTAAVINNTSGNETDQAASVAAMKTYIAGEAHEYEEEIFTLTGTDISNGYVDLAFESIDKSETIWVQGGLMQMRGDDFTTSVPGVVTRVTFQGSLAATLVAGNKLAVNYSYHTI